jgi:hypothetical protein
MVRRNLSGGTCSKLLEKRYAGDLGFGCLGSRLTIAVFALP